MQEQEIDLIELARKLLDQKRVILKACAWAAIIGIVVGFSIPKEYTTEVTLAPETSSGSKGLSGGLSALAGMAGINLGDMQSEDALSPAMYPDIVKSIPFSIELLNVRVKDIKGNLDVSLYE